MAVNLFAPSLTTAAHVVEVGATFVVLLAIAVAIDWCVRCCKRFEVTPALVRLLHHAAMVLAISDLVLISIDVGQTLLARLPLLS